MNLKYFDKIKPLPLSPLREKLRNKVILNAINKF